MEEQNKSKVVSMNAGKQEAKEEQKLTYEQLRDACNQLFEQNKMLINRNRELENFAINKRLDYLFKVLELSKMFNSDFVINCSSEIEEAMTIAPQNDVEPKKE